MPSEPILWQRLKALSQDDAVAAQIDADSLALIARHRPAALRVQGRTYKGMDGFAPIFAYIGTQDWVLHHELRPGTQHCQNGTPEFLKQCIERISRLGLKDEVILRMDSGNDSADNIELLRQTGHRFIIKRNLRQEDPVKWLSHASAQQEGEPERPREGKEVCVGTAEHLRPGGEKSGLESSAHRHRGATAGHRSVCPSRLAAAERSKGTEQNATRQATAATQAAESQARSAGTAAENGIGERAKDHRQHRQAPHPIGKTRAPRPLHHQKAAPAAEPPLRPISSRSNDYFRPLDHPQTWPRLM